MKGFFILILIIIFFTMVAESVRRKGFDQLRIKRILNAPQMIFPQKEFEIITELENKKLIPISFVNICDIYDSNLVRIGDRYSEENENNKYYYSNYSIAGNERVKRVYKVKAKKRGVFSIGTMYVTIGDFFGFGQDTKEIESPIEIVVYPEYPKAKDIIFNNKSLQGDEVIRRWIFQDPMMVRGLHEYNSNHRMKDIHWNSSAKLGKLMAREYDFTGHRKVMFFMNVQFGNPIWSSINEDGVEKIIKITMSLSEALSSQGIAVGATTNGGIVNYYNEGKNYVASYVGNFKDILELGARVHHVANESFYDFLKSNEKYLVRDGINVIVTGYMNDEMVLQIKRLSEKGYSIKIITTSSQIEMCSMPLVEILNYETEEEEYE